MMNGVRVTNDEGAVNIPAALLAGVSSMAIRLLTLAVRGYQLTISPAQTFLFGATGGCRYTPSCSAYAVEAWREHGVAAGTLLSAQRICRCHPWGGCGHDPVPPAAVTGAKSRRK